MGLKEQLTSLIKENSIENNNEQSLREILTWLQIISDELNLDFDSILGRATFCYEDHLVDQCNHADAFPTQDGSVYCPGCGQFIVKGKSFLENNRWRQ